MIWDPTAVRIPLTLMKRSSLDLRLTFSSWGFGLYRPRHQTQGVVWFLQQQGIVHEAPLFPQGGHQDPRMTKTRPRMTPTQSPSHILRCLHHPPPHHPPPLLLTAGYSHLRYTRPHFDVQRPGRGSQVPESTNQVGESRSPGRTTSRRQWYFLLASSTVHFSLWDSEAKIQSVVEWAWLVLQFCPEFLKVR